jgi:hypothetical protein
MVRPVGDSKPALTYARIFSGIFRVRPAARLIPASQQRSLRCIVCPCGRARAHDTLLGEISSRPSQGGMGHLLLGCRPGGLKTRLVAVDTDDRRDVEIELVELLDKFLDPRARPHLTVARADVVGFDKKSFLG